MCKIDIGRERLGNFLMLSKLPTIVISDGVNLTPLRGEYGLNGLSDLFSLFGFRFGQSRILSFSFHKSSDDSAMALANDGIAFPVADTGFFVDDVKKSGAGVF